MHDVMPQLEIPDHGNPFYDHEADADLQLGGRRAVADWGADDLFHHTPRRRRSAASLAARAAGEALTGLQSADPGDLRRAAVTAYTGAVTDFDVEVQNARTAAGAAPDA